MPAFAILGATGNVGRSILSLLVKDPSVKIRCLVRSKNKLYQQTPELQDNKSVRVFESSIDDIETLAECIATCDAVFSCIATQGNKPGTSIALDTAHAVVAALCHIRCAKKSTAALPRIIMLSSATINDHLCRGFSPVMRWFLWTGLRHIYSDLQRAEAYYRMHASWMTATIMQPGGLVDDKQVGHELSTERQQSFLSFLDLAAGIIECGSKGIEDKELDWKCVSVIPTGKTKFNYMAPLNVLNGWVWNLFPFLYPILN
nr:monoogygenase tpcg [Quercus suber]